MKRLNLNIEIPQLRMLSKKELEVALSVTPMTVYLWRKLDDPIPHRIVPVGEKHRVFFPVAAVYNWLVRYRPALAQKIGGLNGSIVDHGVGSRGTDVQRAA